MEAEVLTVSQFNEILNQTLEFAYPAVVIEGEVASFKVNQGKWIFFDLKDEESTVACFMPKFSLKVALEDGMLVRVVAVPKLTKWGKFSLTIREVTLSGEGAVKKAYELMRAQFEKEGLFAVERKRPLPQYPRRVALITSAQAAAYADFVTVLSQRWVGIDIDQAQVQVQGINAPAQIVRAIEYFSSRASNYDVMVIIRGGGSAEDLQAFSHEDVVRAVYGSKLPTIVGIGHEDDVSLAELAADVRAATPTDAARRLVPDKAQTLEYLESLASRAEQSTQSKLNQTKTRIEQFNHAFLRIYHDIARNIEVLSAQNNHNIMSLVRESSERVVALSRLLASADPRAILARGYSVAMVNGRSVTSPSQIKSTSRVVLQLHKGVVELIRPENLRSEKLRRQNKQESNGQIELGL